MKSKNGFTLIELICVMSIISILSCITIPKLGIVRDYEMKNYIQELACDIANLKLKRIANQKGSIKIFRDSYMKVIFLKQDYFNTKTEWVTLPKNMHLRTNIRSKRINFSPGGEPINAGEIFLIDDTRDKVIRLTLMPYTGKVTIYEIHEDLY